MATAAALTENSRQGFEVQKPPGIGLAAELSRNPRRGCGHAYDETASDLAVYVRNDPINLVDRKGKWWECDEYMEGTCVYWYMDWLPHLIPWGSNGDSDSNSVDDCDGVEPVAPYSPDPYPVDEEHLTQETKGALACLRQALQDINGTLDVTSAYRPPEYQQHLQEVYDKYQKVKDWPATKCPSVRQNIMTEWSRHNLTYRPADDSPHSTGKAFDANWWIPRDTKKDIDTLAGDCNLSRPVSGDPHHFVYTP